MIQAVSIGAGNGIKDNKSDNDHDKYHQKHRDIDRVKVIVRVDLCFFRDREGFAHRFDELLDISRHMTLVMLFLRHPSRIAFLYKLFSKLFKPERM